MGHLSVQPFLLNCHENEREPPWTTRDVKVNIDVDALVAMAETHSPSREDSIVRAACVKLSSEVHCILLGLKRARVPAVLDATRNVRSSAEEWDLIAWRVGNAREVRSACALNSACRLPRRLAAVVALLSCSCRVQTVGLDHRPVERVGPRVPQQCAHARCPGCFITGACRSSDWTVPSA